MERDLLEKLLIDRHLGELPPDAAALLDEYLALRPEAAANAGRIGATLDLARDALGSLEPRAADSLPRLRPSGRAGRIGRAPAGQHVPLLRPVALAACLVLAFLLGRRMSLPPAGVAERPPVEFAAGGGAAIAAPAGEFWSVRQWRETAAAQPSPRRTLNWSTPTAWPQPGDRS
jgi:anti-sigma factor RsiW